jgi:hypothetical protein
MGEDVLEATSCQVTSEGQHRDRKFNLSGNLVRIANVWGIYSASYLNFIFSSSTDDRAQDLSN